VAAAAELASIADVDEASQRVSAGSLDSRSSIRRNGR